MRKSEETDRTYEPLTPSQDPAACSKRLKTAPSHPDMRTEHDRPLAGAHPGKSGTYNSYMHFMLVPPPLAVPPSCLFTRLGVRPVHGKLGFTNYRAGQDQNQLPTVLP